MATFGLLSDAAYADEGGVSFWVPGLFGSLAATPQQPGWSLATIYYHTSVSAGGDVALAREFRHGKDPCKFDGALNASLNATGDLGFVIPSYVFATPVLGGQAAISLLGAYGVTSTSLAGTLSGTLSTPFGSIPFMRSDSFSDTTGALAIWTAIRLALECRGQQLHDLHHRRHTGRGVSIPRLANLGIGHGAIDAGGGYTYFNPQTGHEFSAVLGFTYNLKDNSTQYQNGVDMHLDWGASQFLTKQVQVGLVGYAYDEIACDSGSGDRVGCFQSQVFGIGPQFGYVFPLSQGLQGYINLKGYGEFGGSARPSGWNTWLTFVIRPPLHLHPVSVV